MPTELKQLAETLSRKIVDRYRDGIIYEIGQKNVTCAEEVIAKDIYEALLLAQKSALGVI